MKLLSMLLAGLALAAIYATGAGAQSAAPVPCTSTTATDPAGDQAADPVPLVNVPAAASSTEENTDGRAVFFNFKDGVLTANLVVTNLTKEVSAAAMNDGMSYTINFEEPSGIFTQIQARNSGGEISFRHDKYEPLPGDVLQSQTWVETTGTFHEGPMGVISMTMPAELAKEGVKLDTVYARVSITSEEEEEVAYTTADFVPDDGTSSTKSYTVTACPATEAPATEKPAPATPAPATPPASAPAPAPQSQPATQSQPAPKPAAKKKKRKLSCKQKAKKIKNKKKRARALKKCKKAKKKRR